MATQKGKVKLRTGESYRPKEDRFMYRWTDVNGKRHSVYASTIGELREKEQLIQRDILNGVIHTDMTVADLYTKWIKLKVNLKPNSFYSYQALYTNHIEPQFGKKRISDIRKSDVREYCVELVHQNYSAGAIKRIVAVLRQMFELAVDDDQLLKNPASRVLTGILPEAKKKEGLTVDEERELFQFAAKDTPRRMTYLIMCILVKTGLRIGEFCALTWNDVDLETRRISITKTMVVVPQTKPIQLIIGTPKTKTSLRTIPICSDTVDDFLQLKALVDSYHIAQPAVIDGYTNFCCMTPQGEAASPISITNKIAYMAKKCNKYLLQRDGEDSLQIKKMAAHTLRHTFATRMYEAGADPKATQSIMGHATIIMTMDVYTDATEAKTRQALELMVTQSNIQKI